MIDRRLLVAICSALIALAAGVLSLALDAPVLGLVSGCGAVVAASAAAVLTARLRVATTTTTSTTTTTTPATTGATTTGGPAWRHAEEPLDLVALEHAHGPEPSGHPGHADPDPHPDPDVTLGPATRIERPLGYDQHPAGRRTGAEGVDNPATRHGDPGREIAEGAASATDPVTGLLGAPYFYAALDRSVASARRALQPLSLILFELDGFDGDAPPIHTVDDAMEVLGVVLRRTLRECDTACRFARTVAAALLEDTPEHGAVWAAERVRGGLLARPDGEHLTVSAGVASYPSHALDATDLLARARAALDTARAHGTDRVEIARAD